MRKTVMTAPMCVILACALISQMSIAVAQPSRALGTPNDVPLCLAHGSAPAAEPTLLVGYASGRVARVGCAAGQPRVAWEAQADGAILALVELASPGQSGRDVVASTATGRVVCFRGDAPAPVWQFRSTCEVSALAGVADVDGDGATDLVAAGAAQRVHLLSGRGGQELWSQLFESKEGTASVQRLLVIADQNQDAFPEVAVWLWSGELAVLSGRTGNPIWRRPIGGGFTEGFALVPDLNGDGAAELLVGGNDGMVRACSPLDGTVLWSGQVARPIRDVAVQPASATPANVYVASAGGEVARFDPKPQTTPDEPKWTVNLGDVCRSVATTVDVDNDGTLDVAACAENGVVALLSGQTGQVLQRWQASDVVRTICPISTSDQAYIAAASLDGEVRWLPVSGRACATQATNAPTTRPDIRGQPRLISPATAEDPRVIILLYHDVLPEARYHYATSVENFQSQMDALVREKYICVSLDQIADWLEGTGGLPARAVCITFDGQYQGQYTYAYPILRARGLFATSYITTDWIGTPNHCDWHQIREMDEAGVLDAQNHTINHPILTKCARPAQIAQLTGCDRAIERHVKTPLWRHHAYPAGVYDPSVQALLRELGFRTATTVRAGAVTREDDRLTLPRYTLCIHKTLAQFESWLTGKDAPDAGHGQAPPK